MSSKDDKVLDNWDDIDEDGLNTKLNLLKRETMNQQQSSITQQPPFVYNGGGPNRLLLHDDDDLRMQFMPRETTVKILKRPSQPGGGDPRNSSDAKPKPPMKTLQQREQEYAEARLRILGAARSPEEIENPAPEITTIPRPTANGGTPLATRSQQDGILRLPKGPDGTTGFTTRR